MKTNPLRLFQITPIQHPTDEVQNRILGHMADVLNPLIRALHPLLGKTLIDLTTAPASWSAAGDLGQVAVVSASLSVGTIALGVITPTAATATDALVFEVGMTVQASTVGSLRAALGYVIAVDKAAKTITVSTSLGGAAASPAGWAAGDLVCGSWLYLAVAANRWTRQAVLAW